MSVKVEVAWKKKQQPAQVGTRGTSNPDLLEGDGTHNGRKHPKPELVLDAKCVEGAAKAARKPQLGSNGRRGN
jgi:hypothetical protein